jgi:hypothetical protein
LPQTFSSLRCLVRPEECLLLLEQVLRLSRLKSQLLILSLQCHWGRVRLRLDCLWLLVHLVVLQGHEVAITWFLEVARLCDCLLTGVTAHLPVVMDRHDLLVDEFAQLVSRREVAVLAC